METKIVIDRNEILELANEGGKLVLSPNAENNLVKLLDIQEFINQVVEDVKTSIVTQGIELDEDFKGIVGEKVRATYRYTDSLYTYRKADFEIAEPFLKKIEYYKVDSDKVAEYENENGELPEGIGYKDRTKKLVIKYEKD